MKSVQLLAKSSNNSLWVTFAINYNRSWSTTAQDT